MLILTEYIANHEFKPVMRVLGIDDILEGAKKVLRNLAIETKAPAKVPGVRFFKVRIGKKGGGRMMVLLMVDKKVVPMLIRLKTDKTFGMNMAMNNPRVVQQLKKNLDRVLQDIAKKQYEEFNL